MACASVSNSILAKEMACKTDKNCTCPKGIMKGGAMPNAAHTQCSPVFPFSLPVYGYHIHVACTMQPQFFSTLLCSFYHTLLYLFCAFPAFVSRGHSLSPCVINAAPNPRNWSLVVHQSFSDSVFANLCHPHLTYGTASLKGGCAESGRRKYIASTR